ncbi:hypothetical protein CRG98_016708, partial [Punica granatum]
MLADDPGQEEVDQTGKSYTFSATLVAGLRREPSFSRWCSEDCSIHLKGPEDSSVLSLDESDFELPILRQHELLNGLLGESKHLYSKRVPETMHVNGSHDMGDVSKPVEGDTSEHYASFDVENGSATQRRFLNIDADGPTSTGSHKVSSQYSDSFSVANVLKTLFFILVWYTFSTFLTLYNKTLLGDDMGRFPAPLLMNTVHFTMQAVLSRAIIWYRCKRHQSSVTMSWRDYFSKAPIFLLLFAFAFRLESPSIKLLGIMSVISVGILLTVAKEAAFEFWGFIFVMLAAVMSGFRWCMTQILLQ